MTDAIRVLIVDDSEVVRCQLRQVLEGDPALQVVGEARDGMEACSLVAQLRPDVVTMDIEMPGMNGFEATRRILELRPVPIVIVSASWDRKSVNASLQAMQAGAVAAVAKPPGASHPNHGAAMHKLVETVKLMAEVKIVRRWSRLQRQRLSELRQQASPPGTMAGRALHGIRVVAVGASTGGPPALQRLLAGLPRDFSVPILIVQHIAAGFTAGLAEWLRASTGFRVQVAESHQVPRPGTAYLAPDGWHLEVNANLRLQLTQAPPEHGMRPAVSCLFRSVARHYASNAAAVLLTGMGRDGAQELFELRKQGAVTMAQDRDSSVVFGMPGEAIRLGAAQHVLPPESIAALLGQLIVPGTSTMEAL